MRVEIWSDVVCPWCYIGKRRFEVALADFPHRDEVEVVWRAFELDSGAPQERRGDYAVMLSQKYGFPVEQGQQMIDTMTAAAAKDGLDFHFEIARVGNTFDAHRLLHLASERGVQDAVKERLLRATFTEGEPIGDHDALVRLVAEAGLETGEARDVLTSGRFAAEVRADEEQARAYGISGVPYFVVDEKYGVSGAQPSEVLGELLATAWADNRPRLVTTNGAALGCDGGSCAV
jgi:predicted DsbA family dithiol-disulfide isomerase